MATCQHCGGTLVPDGKFCPHCGAPVSAPEQQPYNTSAPQYAQPCAQPYYCGYGYGNGAPSPIVISSQGAYTLNPYGAPYVVYAQRPAPYPPQPVVVQEPVEEPEEKEVKPAKKPVNGFAIVGLILAFFGPLALFGLILSCIGLHRVKVKGTGKAVAILGIIISVLMILSIGAAAIVHFCFTPLGPIEWLLSLFS